jgi:hypothetical protein
MARTPVPEAKLVATEAGMKPEGEGWFVVNMADSMSMGMDESQYGFIFEGAPRSFPHFGINVRVLGPGKPAAMYHAEAGQEAFLVLTWSASWSSRTRSASCANGISSTAPRVRRTSSWEPATGPAPC